VRLRAWRVEDGPRLVEAAHDPLVRARLPRAPLPTTLGDVDAYLLRVALRAAEGDRVAWCVTDAADLALGNVAVFGFEDGSAEVGFWSHPEGRGRGVVSRAVAVATTHAFDHLGVRRLDLLTAASNPGARAVAERTGFTLVGIERASAPTAEGGWADTVRYELPAPTAS
jgi:RimJ/RimL family protein N-acetyltransferase